MTATGSIPGRAAVSLLTAGYGAFVVIANARNDVITSDRTSDWLLFGSRTDFPGEFGRATFGGTIALGVLFLALAVATWATAGKPSAWWPAGVAAVLALVILVSFRPNRGFLGSGPSASAVMLAVALYLAASAMVRDSSTPVGLRGTLDDDRP
jgi:hypothetical protein